MTEVTLAEQIACMKKLLWFRRQFPDASFPDAEKSVTNLEAVLATLRRVERGPPSARSNRWSKCYDHIYAGTE